MTTVAADLNSNALRRVVGNAGLLLGGRGVNALLGLGYMALGARSLGVKEFGVLVLIHAFAQFLGDVVKFQSWQTVLQYGAAPLAQGHKAQFQRVLRFTIVLDMASSLLAVLLGAVGAYLLAGRLGWGQQDATPAAFYSLTAVFMVAATPLGLLRLFDRFDVMARQTALAAFVRLVGSGIAYLMHWPMEGFLLMWGLGTMAGFGYLVWASWGELSRRGLLQDFNWRGPLAHNMPGAWKFAWTTNLSATMEVAFTHVATLMVGALLGPSQAALWRVGRQVADAMAKPANLLIPALYPELARMRAAAGESAMWRLALQIALICGGAGAVLLIGAATLGGLLLSLIMGHGFEEGAGAMTWQVGAAVVAIFALPLEPMLVSLGRPGEALKAHVVVCLIFLIILPLAIRHWGVDGAGGALVAAAIALAFGMLLGLLRARKAAPATAESTCGPDAGA